MNVYEPYSGGFGYPISFRRLDASPVATPFLSLRKPDGEYVDWTSSFLLGSTHIQAITAANWSNHVLALTPANDGDLNASPVYGDADDWSGIDFSAFGTETYRATLYGSATYNAAAEDWFDLYYDGDNFRALTDYQTKLRTKEPFDRWCGYLRQSTPTTIAVGPLTQWLAAGPTLITNALASLPTPVLQASKNGGAAIDVGNLTGQIGGGLHPIPLDADVTDTLGELAIFTSSTSELPSVQRYTVISAVAFDKMVGGEAPVQTRAIRPAAFQLRAGKRRDRKGEATEELRLYAGTLNNIDFDLDVSPILGDGIITDVGTPTVTPLKGTSTSVTATAVGGRDGRRRRDAQILLGGTLAQDERVAIEFEVTVDGPKSAKFVVIVTTVDEAT